MSDITNAILSVTSLKNDFDNYILMTKEEIVYRLNNINVILTEIKLKENQSAKAK